MIEHEIEAINFEATKLFIQFILNLQENESHNIVNLISNAGLEVLSI